MQEAKERGVLHNEPVFIGTNRLRVVIFPFDTGEPDTGILCFLDENENCCAEIVKKFRTIRAVEPNDMYNYLNGRTHLNMFNQLVKKKGQGIVRGL